MKSCQNNSASPHAGRALSLPGCLFQVLLLWAVWASAPKLAAATLTVAADRPGHLISPTLFGIFFEDINCSADGGLYAELVRNRNFEDSDAPDYWKAADADTTTLSVDSTVPVTPQNPHSLKVVTHARNQKRRGVINEGFWGMAVEKGQTYELTFFARGDALVTRLQSH
ncbi:MAG TPA: hypothetical protein VLT36_05005 [Candidatus Dormibacteraeota bacterium]|nr:hypothetical protein [Candidatus Dormibacteraeota bacterium]